MNPFCFPLGEEVLEKLRKRQEKKYQAFWFLSELAGLHVPADTIIIARAHEQGEERAVLLRTISDFHLPNMAISQAIITLHE